ncbi:CapA family protein [Lachnospiraceae bacterium KGMB03038]|nr:CapA family protein [Lachnospiraceae bacterium KGMB03038]
MSGIKEHQRRRARRRRRRQIRRLLYAALSLCICIGLIAIIRLLLRPDSPDSAGKADKAAEKSAEIDTSQVEVKNLVINTGTQNSENSDGPIKITVSSMGDCTLGTDENFNQSTSFNAYYNAQGPDYFFKNVRSILEEDDLSIINLEGTFTDSDQRQEKTFAFKADPEYVSILTGSSIEAANLANNHSRDYGEESYTDTVETLDQAGIASFGYDQVDLLEINGVKVGLTGIYELAEHLDKQQEVKENIAALKEAGAQVIIVNFHWGIEKEYVPNDTQKTLAHLAIDEGADLVIGHHPHVLQGIERYKGKYIAYSLGNFSFGGNSNPSDKDTMIFQQTFTVADGKAETNDDINIIPCSLSSASGYNDYCPTPLEGSEKERVLEKLQEYSADFEDAPDLL